MKTPLASKSIGFALLLTLQSFGAQAQFFNFGDSPQPPPRPPGFVPRPQQQQNNWQQQRPQPPPPPQSLAPRVPMVMTPQAQPQPQSQVQPQVIAPAAIARPLSFPAMTEDQTALAAEIKTRLVGAGPNLTRLYQARDFRPIWVSSTSILQSATDLRSILIKNPESSGLVSGDYWTTEEDQLMSSRETSSLLDLEIMLSKSYLSYANDLGRGRTDPQDKTQNLTDIEFSIIPSIRADYLNSILGSRSSMELGLYKLEPMIVNYQKLITALASLRNARAMGGWPALDLNAPVLGIGMSHPNVPGIRIRLADMGALPISERNNRSLVFDDALRNAIIRLQQVTFQSADGRVGKNVYKALAISLDDRIDQVRANLERWRLLPRNLDDDAVTHRFLFVDMGRQELDVIENNQVVLRMRVVVGLGERSTPSMVDRVSSVVVNPYWYPPTSLIAKDILPKAVQDPTYLDQLHMQVLQDGKPINTQNINWTQYQTTDENGKPTLTKNFPFLFREDTGENNSLGLLKFNLNNSHSIYMHDTNHRELFERQVRYFSSGCIRLQKPRELAEYLLRDQGYDVARIDEEIQNPANVAKTIKLTRSERVYIFGSTMTVYQDGMIGFGADIYGQDKRIIDAMAGKRITAPAVAKSSPSSL